MFLYSEHLVFELGVAGLGAWAGSRRYGSGLFVHDLLLLLLLRVVRDLLVIADEILLVRGLWLEVLHFHVLFLISRGDHTLFLGHVFLTQFVVRSSRRVHIAAVHQRIVDFFGVLRFPVLWSGLFRWSWPRHLGVMDPSWAPLNVLSPDHVYHGGLAGFRILISIQRAVLLVLTWFLANQVFVIPSRNYRSHVVLLAAAKYCTGIGGANCLVTLSTVARDRFLQYVMHFSSRFLGGDWHVLGVFWQWNHLTTRLLDVLWGDRRLWRGIDLPHPLNHC